MIKNQEEYMSRFKTLCIILLITVFALAACSKGSGENTTALKKYLMERSDFYKAATADLEKVKDKAGAIAAFKKIAAELKKLKVKRKAFRSTMRDKKLSFKGMRKLWKAQLPLRKAYRKALRKVRDTYEEDEDVQNAYKELRRASRRGRRRRKRNK